jgi:hypothetical protein
VTVVLRGAREVGTAVQAAHNHGRPYAVFRWLMVASLSISIGVVGSPTLSLGGSDGSTIQVAPLGSAPTQEPSGSQLPATVAELGEATDPMVAPPRLLADSRNSILGGARAGHRQRLERPPTF